MKTDSTVAIVTGGASGLGAACARQLVQKGARVVACDVNETGGAALERSLGDRCRFQCVDVTSVSDVERAIDVARKEFGGLGLAVNCAGVVTAGKVVGKKGPADLDAFSRTIEINLVGTFNVSRLAAAAMAENEPGDDGERGVIINTSSVSAYEGQMGQAAYAASKGGVASMTLPMARDLASHGIRVVAIAPGVFQTPMMAGMPDKVRETIESQIPFPSRLGHPDEFAALVQHILENRMLNGAVLRLDGALRMTAR